MITELGKISTTTKGTHPGAKLDPSPLMYPKIYSMATWAD
jgi:hypothetical protein